MKSFSMKPSDKKLLFEMMEKINPDFKMNEITNMPVRAKSGAVQNLQKAVNDNPTIQYADSRIVSPEQLEAAFGTWLSRTGFGANADPRRPLTISQMQTHVRNAMEKLGYR